MSPHNPKLWTDSEEVTLFFARLAKAQGAVLMLDYDGTLAPFTDKRMEAVLYPGVRERLEKLLTLHHDHLVLISGRKAHELQTLIALRQPIEIWGSHGREHLQVNGGYSVEELTEEENRALEQIQKELEAAYGMALLECKPNSVTVHWRGATGRKDEIQKRVKQTFSNFFLMGNNQGELQLLNFDGGLEIRAGNVNKGDAVKKTMAGMPQDTAAAFLGDDTTDEDAFQALLSGQQPGDSLTLLVRSDVRKSLAQAWLRPPEDLLAFLDRWIEIREHKVATAQVGATEAS
jgi:trehalose-phosphatase